MASVEKLATGALVLLAMALFFFPFQLSSGQAAWYDNTTVLTQLNVTNLAPFIESVTIYDNDTLGGAPNIILTQGITDTVFCNFTVTDYNGYLDINDFNATLFHDSSSHGVADDRNYHYTNQTCYNTTINGGLNLTSISVQCAFTVWFYANNGTWTCNATAFDGEAENHSSNTRTIDPLFALDLNTSIIDYGELAPGASSTDDVPVLVTNFGNMDINVSVEGYGVSLHDGLSMDCETGDINVRYEKYSTQPGEAINTMTNLTTNPILTGISGLTILQNIDDNGNSTNNTFWKMEVPFSAGLKGFCNGTVLFSGIGPV